MMYTSAYGVDNGGTTTSRHNVCGIHSSKYMPGPLIGPVLSDVSYGSFKWLENILDQVTFNYELDNLRFLSSRLIMKKIKKN